MIIAREKFGKIKERPTNHNIEGGNTNYVVYLRTLDMPVQIAVFYEHLPDYTFIVHKNTVPKK